MGKFTLSLVILLVAVSTPLIYRQFANDNTIKFMSSYYSNYKLIDQFLRQSAGHLDRVKEYMPDSKQLEGYVSQMNEKINTMIEKSKSFASQDRTGKGDPPKNEEKSNVLNERLVQCPNEDTSGQNIRLWSKEELAKYDGNHGETDVYLGFLGLVYNVTVNMQHYASGAEYNVFAGRDATRAFLTGNFTHDLHDDIHDIEAVLYTHLDSWATFYVSNYPILGRIEGAFFDSNGCGTPELGRVKQVIDNMKRTQASEQEQGSKLPDCNSEWNSDLKQGRVWCSTKSGGVEREWAGLPRIYDDGESQRCVCFNPDDPSLASYHQALSGYPGCEAGAGECILKQ